MFRFKFGEEVKEINRENIREGNSSGSEKGMSTTKGSRYGGSSTTIWSEDRLCNREVEKIRKWVGEKKREERRENIVLRGVVCTTGRSGKDEGKKQGMDKKMDKG